MLPTHAARASSPLAVLISQGIQRSAPGKQDWQLHTCAAWVLGFRVPGEKKSSGRTPACQSARPCRPEAAAWLAANVKSARFPAAARGFAAAPPPPHLASCRVSTLTGHLQGPGRSSERQQRSLRQHFRRVHAASRTTQGLPGSTFRPRKYIPCTPVSVPTCLRSVAAAGHCHWRAASCARCLAVAPAELLPQGAQPAFQRRQNMHEDRR